MAVSRIPNAAEGFNPAPPDWLGHCPQKVAEIIQGACERNRVSVRRLMLGRKTHAVTRARWEACAELRQMPWGIGVIYGGVQLHPGPSLPQIGLWLHMDHASVLFAVRAVADEVREPGGAGTASEQASPTITTGQVRASGPLLGAAGC